MENVMRWRKIERIHKGLGKENVLDNLSACKVFNVRVDDVVYVGLLGWNYNVQKMDKNKSSS